MSNPVVEWEYASIDDEREAIRWYLRRHLNAETKLDLELGLAVNAYEYLRHVVKLPDLGRFIQVPLKAIRTGVWLSADVKAELEIEEFPKLPFTKLSTASKKTVLGRFNAECPTFYPMDITEVADCGVLRDLAQLAQDGKHSEGRVVAEVQVSPQHSAIVLSIDFGAGPKRAEYWIKRWIEENKHQFAKAGRTLAGTRAKNSPLIELKDLAVARLLALHSFNSKKASQWARTDRPRDSDGRVIRWFNRRGAKNAGAASPLFKEFRDWDRAAVRFEKRLQAYLV